ncbi:MAG: undecaprenyldiphospho-muramoylpentapeptide beta-N-acetylglucosaminyltransferase [Alphaproteobacteria bacterium]|nr:undecaprenyldiphospho-muramoylpentapeptide beta-N-acetylglucosaminyltransferase [Alphaproteobacteria bacterium]
MTTILLAAGGTGGHVFPAVAVAEQLRQRGHRTIFITDHRGKKMIPDDFRRKAIFAASPYGATLMARLKGMTKLALGMAQTTLTLLWHRPGVVIGFGGYPAVAPVLMGRIMGMPTMLHEQNAFFGRANGFLAQHAAIIGLSWEMTKNIPSGATSKTALVGMPVRNAFSQIAETGYTAPEDNGEIRLLIVGGSLGAAVFGDTVPEAISRLPKELRARLNVTHQVRESQFDDVRAKYDAAGIKAELAPFIHDMAEKMAATHLVIGRAGASSVAELAAAGRPAMLVPYPDAMDDHQTANAEAVVSSGGGWLIPEHEMSAGSLAGKIATLISSPDRLRTAADAIQSLNSSHAAGRIADQLLSLTASGDRL